MKTRDVPQDKGVYGEWHGINYAVDEDGKYVLSPSAGWEPANWANHQAWELVEEEIKETLEKVRQGKLSPLAYHMARSMMDVGMVARYMGIARWRVRRHLKSRPFGKLGRNLLERYAAVLRVSAEDLVKVP
jgi:hypothetical protein